MSIASEIERLSGVRGDIFTSITNKGVTVPVGSTFSSCPSLIDQIQGGGGDPTSLINPTFTASGFVSAYVPFTATQIPFVNPEYDVSPAYSGAAYSNQMPFYTVFLHQSHLHMMSYYYEQYGVPSYLIFSAAASSNYPNSQLIEFGHKVSEFFRETYPFRIIGTNQNNPIATFYMQNIVSGCNYEYNPNMYTNEPTAMSAYSILDLTPCLNVDLWEQNTPSSTQYGYGFSLSFQGTNEWMNISNFISGYNGELVSAISAVTGVTTANPYPSYPSATTGYIENKISGIEKWDNGKAILSSDALKTVNYYNSPSTTSTTNQTSSYVDTFSSNMMKNYTQSKINEAGNDFNYSYTYGLSETAYSGFEGI